MELVFWCIPFQFDRVSSLVFLELGTLFLNMYDDWLRFHCRVFGDLSLFISLDEGVWCFVEVSISMYFFFFFLDGLDLWHTDQSCIRY